MSALDTKTIKARADAATPGEWFHDRGQLWACVTERPNGHGALVTANHVGTDAEQMARLEFIAAARTDVPALCARVEALEATLRDTLDRYVSLANSGDAGFWNPEEEPHVIAARAALGDAP